MPFVPFPTGCSVTIVMELPQKLATNNIHFEGAAAWSDVAMSALLLELWDVFEETWPGSHANTVSIRRMQARALDTEFGEAVSLEPESPIMGSSASPVMPNNIAAVTTLNTGYVGRSYRGRVYNCGVTEGAITENTISSTVIGLLNTLWNNVRLITSTNNPVFSVASRYVDGDLRVTGLATPVSSVNTNSRVDTQRRRLPRNYL